MQGAKSRCPNSSSPKISFAAVSDLRALLTIDNATMGCRAPEEDPSMPQFFQSTKFFAVLDVEEARVLFDETPKVSDLLVQSDEAGGGERGQTMITMVRLAPHEVLFCASEPSDSGIYIVETEERAAMNVGLLVPVCIQVLMLFDMLLNGEWSGRHVVRRHYVSCLASRGSFWAVLPHPSAVLPSMHEMMHAVLNVWPVQHHFGSAPIIARERLLKPACRFGWCLASWACFWTAPPRP
eukprot:292751-Pelagomonas_calceolata.AAC.1